MVNKDVVSIDIDTKYSKRYIISVYFEDGVFETWLDEIRIEFNGHESKMFSITRDNVSAKIRGDAVTDPSALQRLIVLYTRNCGGRILDDDYIRLINLRSVLKDGRDAVCLFNSRSNGQKLICRIKGKFVELQDYAIGVYEDGVRLLCKKGSALIANIGESFDTGNLRNALSEIQLNAYANMTLEDIEAA